VGTASEIPAHVPAELVVDADIYDLPGRERDPQLAWKALDRPGGPGLVWSTRNGGHWIATAGELILELLGDTERVSAKDLSVPPGTTIYAMIPNQSDEPEHRHYRNIILPFLRPAPVKALAPDVRALAIELIEGFRDKGCCEFMSDFARHLPMLIFLRLVDLPAEDREWLIARADIMVRCGDTDMRFQAQKEIEAYLRRWLDERRAAPGTDMLSAILQGQVGDRPMNDAEIMGESMDVMFGGLDTVASMMGFIMRFLATHPSHRRQLVENPKLIPVALEEMLRRYGIATVARRVLMDITHEGVTMHKGDMVVLPTCLHGVDERIWDHPLQVDFARPRRTHGTFGTGVHACPGAPLARSEITIAIEEWLARIPDFSVAVDDVGQGLTGSVNALSSLHLEWPVS
jgi:cytochrome P450